MSQHKPENLSFRKGDMTIYGESGHGEAVCDAPEGSEGMRHWESNAARIVHRYNCHDDLLEALKEVQKTWGMDPLNHNWHEIREQVAKAEALIEAAIRKAKE